MNSALMGIDSSSLGTLVLVLDNKEMWELGFAAFIVSYLIQFAEFSKAIQRVE